MLVAEGDCRLWVEGGAGASLADTTAVPRISSLQRPLLLQPGDNKAKLLGHCQCRCLLTAKYLTVFPSCSATFS